MAIGAGLAVEPHAGQIVAEVMAGRKKLPAVDALVVHDDALPPEQHDVVGLADRVLLEFAGEFLALGGIQRTLLALEQLVDLLVAMLGVGHRRLHGRGHHMHVLQVGVVAMVGNEINRHVEVTTSQRIVEQLGLELLVLGLDADLPPLVDGVDAGRRVGLADVAVEQFELEASTPASSSSCLASSRDLAMSLLKPGSFSAPPRSAHARSRAA